MIDPHNLHNEHRSDAELQEFFLFSIMAAFKDADREAAALDSFLSRHRAHEGEAPFDVLARIFQAALPYGTPLADAFALEATGLQYQIEMAFRRTLMERDKGLDLRTATRRELMAIPKVGRKTASLFILHSRANERIAALDTYVMEYLRDLQRDLGFHPAVSLPQQARDLQREAPYLRAEGVFVAAADALNMKCWELDVAVWKTYRAIRAGLPHRDKRDLYPTDKATSATVVTG